MVASEQPHELTWGGLMLAEPDADALADLPYQFLVLGEGSTFGNPVSVIESIRSLLTDGSVAIRTGTDNRAVTLPLAIVADDGEQLAVAEAALMLEVMADDPAALRWVPPAVESAPCNFDVLVADMDRGFPDLWELHESKRLTRYFTLTLTCLPWVRPDEPVVVEALPLEPETEPVVTDVDTCGSITNWTRETNGGSPSGPTAVTVSGETAIEVSASIDSASDYLRLVRTASIAAPVGEFIAVDAQLVAPANIKGNWSAYFSGSWRSPITVVAGAGEAGSTRLYFGGTGTIGSIKLAFNYTRDPAGPTYISLRVFNVAVTDQIVLPSATKRERLRTLEVLGSAPTTAALRLFTDTDDLGTQGLIFTGTSGEVFPPPLRTWLDSSAAVTADTDMVSGARNTLDDPMVFLIPANLLASGTYALVAKIRRDASPTIRTIDWSAKVTDDTGADVLASDVVTSGSIDVTLADTSWHLRQLASLALPPVKLDDGDGYAVEITLDVASAGIEVLVDEAWLFDTDRGAFTMWNLPADAGLSWIEVRSPELDAPLPAVYGGTGGSDLLEAQDISRYVDAFGVHRFPPGTLLVFTACSGSIQSQASAEYYTRHHSHVAFGAEES